MKKKKLFENRIRSKKNMFGLQKNEVFVEDLFKELKEGSYINCDYKYFKAMFIPSLVVIVKVKWHGTLGELVIIFDTLAAEGIIPKTFYIAKLIRNNFLDRNGQPIKNNCLWTLRNTIGVENALEVQNMINKLGR